MSKTKYYKYPHYPTLSTRVINCIPGEILYDSIGNIYKVSTELEGFDFKKEKIINTVLNQGYKVDDGGLSELQFNKLFVVLSDKKLNKKLDNIEK